MRGVAGEKIEALQDELRALGLLDADAGAEAVRNVVPSPLAGFDPSAPLDARPLVAALEALLSREKALHALPAKFGFSVDGGGGLPLDGVTTDIAFAALPDDADASCRAAGRPVRGRRRAAKIFAPPRKASRAISCGCAARTAAWRALVERLGLAPLLEGVAAVAPRASEAGVPPASEPAYEKISARSTAARKASSAPACCSAASRPTRWSFWREQAQDFGAAELRLTPWRAILAVGLEPAAAEPLAARLAAAASCSTRRSAAGLRGLSRRAGLSFGARRRARAWLWRWRRIWSAQGGRIHVSGCAKGCALNAPAMTFVAEGDGYSIWSIMAWRAKSLRRAGSTSPRCRPD